MLRTSLDERGSRRRNGPWANGPKRSGSGSRGSSLRRPEGPVAQAVDDGSLASRSTDRGLQAPDPPCEASDSHGTRSAASSRSSASMGFTSPISSPGSPTRRVALSAIVYVRSSRRHDPLPPRRRRSQPQAAAPTRITVGPNRAALECDSCNARPVSSCLRAVIPRQFGGHR